MIAGAVDYLSDGLAEPETVRIATKAYEVEQDTVGRFVLECCETGPAGAQTFSIASSELRLAYERWCSEAGETPVSAKAFSSALKTRFDVVLTRTMHTRMLDGIRLQNDMTDASSGSEEEKWWDR
jgi:putative DNA primase/helicase